MKLERIPKYRIPLTEDTYLVVERDEEGWRLVGDGDWLSAEACIFIPHAAVGLLVEALTTDIAGPQINLQNITGLSGESLRDLFGPYTPLRPEEKPQPKAVDLGQGVSLQPADGRRRATPSPGYREVIPGEVGRDGDEWKDYSGHTWSASVEGWMVVEQSSGIILQRRDPDAVAAGHNPHKLTNAQVGVYDGWRLISLAEQAERAYDGKAYRPLQMWYDSRGWSEGDTKYVTDSQTFRTKAATLEVVP